MPTNNFLFYFGQICAGLVRDLVLFPVWWYTQGLVELIQKVVSWWSDSLKSLNLSVWLKNILVPMYGQRDLTGILISIFMRIVQIILRGFWFVCLLIAGAVVIALWIFLPVLILWQIIWQLT
jgi:hypothetical protein